MWPVLRVLQPQVRFPADSNLILHEIQCLTLILIGDKLAKRRAWFFNSISFTTDGGNFLIVFAAFCTGGVLIIVFTLGTSWGLNGKLVFNINS